VSLVRLQPRKSSSDGRANDNKYEKMKDKRLKVKDEGLKFFMVKTKIGKRKVLSNPQVSFMSSNSMTF
jgi:hypothetical protein